MATLKLTSQLPVKSSDEIADDILRTIRNGLVQNGITNANVTPESDFGIVARGLANEVAVANNNAIVISNQVMPDTATGADLDRYAANYSLVRRNASPASGTVTVAGIPSMSSLVPAGAQLVSNSGLRFQVAVGGIYTDGDSMRVVALDVGSQTNVSGSSLLTWKSPPPFFSPTVTVSNTDPISGGVNAEDDDSFRARLLYLMANPPGAGNPSQLMQYALDSDPSVTSAFVYPAARGPATFDVCVLQSATSSSKNRNISQLTIANVISPAVIGNVPQFADGYVCTVSNYPIDISIALSLPDAATGNPAGPGGGFLDGAPMQISSGIKAIRVVDGSGYGGGTNTSTTFCISVGEDLDNTLEYNISYLSSDWILYSAKTIAGTYSQPSSVAHPTVWQVTINSPFYDNASARTAITVGSYIFPTALNTATYVKNVLDFFAGMGPGERVDPSGQSQLLPRAYRLPRETQAFPYKLNNRILRPLEDNSEINDAAIIFRGDGGTTDTSAFTEYADGPYVAGQQSYAPPIAYLENGTSLGPSYVFVPRRIGIYQLNS